MSALARLVAVLATTLALVAGVPASSQAFTTYDNRNMYGGVTPSQVVGRGLYVGGDTFPRPAIRMNAPMVTRSNATSGAQTVTYRLRMFEWSNVYGWQNIWSTVQSSWTIPAGTSRIWLSPYEYTFKRYTTNSVHVQMDFTWYDSAGRYLGSRSVTMNQAGDYSCLASSYVSCSVGNGFVTVS